MMAAKKTCLSRKIVNVFYSGDGGGVNSGTFQPTSKTALIASNLFYNSLLSFQRGKRK